MKNKGQASALALMFVDFILLGLVVVLIHMNIKHYLDVHAIIVSSEVERHVINMANVMLSSEELAYSDEYRIYRGVLDKNKLNAQLVNKATFQEVGAFNVTTHITQKIGYPNSFYVVYVDDFESDDRWFLSGTGPAGESDVMNFFSCLIYELPDDPIELYRRSFSVTFPWYMWDIAECEATLQSKVGTYVKSFPVAIKSSDEIHTGRLILRVTELW